MNLQHEYLVLALHEAKARDYEREAEMDRLAREAKAARNARRDLPGSTWTPWWRRLFGLGRAVSSRPGPDCRPAVAR